MDKASGAADTRIGRRVMLKAGAALAAVGPAVLHGGHAEAQPSASRATARFAYVGAFTTPERKGHGGGINVYRVDPASGAWMHEQLLEIANPSFLTLDRAQRFLYSVHADLEEVSAYAIDKQNGHITALDRQSCGGVIIDFFVDPAMRRHGIGRRLIEAVAKEARAGGSIELVWAVYRANGLAYAFYESLGAEHITDLTLMRLRLK